MFIVIIFESAQLRWKGAQLIIRTAQLSEVCAQLSRNAAQFHPPHARPPLNKPKFDKLPKKQYSTLHN